MKKILCNKKMFWLFVSPGVIFVMFYVFVPLFQVIYYSLFDYSFVGRKLYVGLRNYKELFFEDGIFLIAVKNTLFVVIFSAIFQQVFGIGIAGLLMNTKSFKNLFKNVYYLPMVLSSVALGLMWLFLFNEEFGINNLLRQFDINAPSWLNDPKGFICLPMVVIAIVCVWKYFGQYMMLYLAQMSSISSEVYESASMDGASKIQIFFKITIPLIKPMLLITSLINALGAIKIFDMVYSLTKGGPNNKTEVLVTYLYEQAFNYSKVGYASSIGVIIFIISMVVMLIINFGIKVENYEI